MVSIEKGIDKGSGIRLTVGSQTVSDAGHMWVVDGRGWWSVVGPW